MLGAQGPIVFDRWMPPEPAVSEDDFREILAQTRHFVRTAVLPRESEIAESDRIPDDLRQQAKQMGLFGYAIPQEWGGLGLNIAQDVELALELGYTSLAVRSMFGTNNGIAFFNDSIRDGLKGSVFSDTDTGFVSGKADQESLIAHNVLGCQYDADAITTC